MSLSSRVENEWVTRGLTVDEPSSFQENLEVEAASITGLRERSPVQACRSGSRWSAQKVPPQ
jgi:hypothetical protein